MEQIYRILHIPTAKLMPEYFKTKQQAATFLDTLSRGWYFTDGDDFPYILTYGYRDKALTKLKLVDDYKYQFEIVEECIDDAR